jgi:NADH dehydrogenase [ubiquinone] 1 alpha subcomplex assembly factor 6
MVHPTHRWQHHQVQQAFAECQEIVRKHDYENFLWVRTLPESYRAPVTMLRAFNVETSRIGDLVTRGGAPLREMRFAWWKKSIDATFSGEDVNHPVLTALRFSLGVLRLSKYRLQRILAAKAQDQVTHAAFASIPALEEFAEATQSNLLYLHLESAVIGGKNADHAASHLGKAIGIIGLLRGQLHFLSRGISYLPLDECAKNGVCVEELYQGTSLRSEGLREVVYRMACCAKGHLQASKDLHGRAEAVPVEVQRLFLPAVACELYLEALQKCNFNLTDPRLVGGGYTPLWLTLKLKYRQTWLAWS